MPEDKHDPPTQEPVAPPPQPPAASKIGIEDFARVEMRVGQILEAERVEGSRKLIKMRVDIGSEMRQVVAGIAGAYEPADLLNRKIILVANLKPAKLMGIVSDGMVLAATAGERPILATFAEDVPNGALLK
ncbi:MAG: methionine--tRNA ligase subunit beta [Acidobacteriia bacterium]|nr:methionine--tRNA ligase subunit beta [Terriglobia bacterium]